MNLQNLNSAQLAAVTAPLGPTLVLAGAGTGKTRVLTNRILYLVQEYRVNPSEILAITFTNKAANEMKRRLFDFQCNAQFMHISTIHSFCATVLRRESSALGRNSNFSIYDEEEKKSLLKKIAREFWDECDAKNVDKLSEGISSMKNNLTSTGMLDSANTVEESFNATLDEYIESQLEQLSQSAQSSREDLLKTISQYNEKMQQNNALDFDDLLYFVHKLFSRFPDILEKYRERYKYILIDEFQDTNKVQYEIFRLLGEKYGNIFVVGDDDQSIYSWRGAEAYNLMKFSKDFADCKIYKLEQNYRSTKRILDVANNIIAKNADRFEKSLWTENEEGVKVQLFTAHNEHDEAYFVCEQIKQLLSRGYTLSDFAVLARVNALSRSFEQEFQRNGMPHRVYGGFRFYERKEIKDVIGYLRLIVNPCDSEAFLRVINVPRRRGIGDTTLEKLRNLSAEYGISLVDVISDERNLEIFNSSTRAKLLDFYKLYSELCDLSQKLSLKNFVHSMLDVLEFRKVYQDAGDDDRALNIDEFEQSVGEFQQVNPTVGLAEFLQSVSLLSSVDEGSVENGFITIATIHAVKGLEFKVVFVVGLEEGIFPSRRSSYSSRENSEERRLMYVAVTRAEKRLYLTRANDRFLWGAHKRSYASTYFSETQKFLQPQRAPASERQLEDTSYLDKLINTEPIATAPNQGKSKNEIPPFKVGQMVQHKAFGRGMILRISGETADVVFENVGKKSLNVRFAPMTIIK